MHSPYRASFDEPDGWEAPGEGVRGKRVTNGPASLRLIEMLSTASHPDWCEMGHSGCVVEGELEIEFANHVVRYQTGDGIVIPPGPQHRHRPHALSERVRLALVDWQG
jgi:quercetin dioxygenase-like cupin family protein